MLTINIDYWVGKFVQNDLIRYLIKDEVACEAITECHPGVKSQINQSVNLSKLNLIRYLSRSEQELDESANLSELNVIRFCIPDEAACEALTDMPPRSEEELDAVSLHNQALMNMESNPTNGFQKLQFLIQQNPFPPETFGNLLLLYIKFEVRLLDLECVCLIFQFHFSGSFHT